MFLVMGGFMLMDSSEEHIGVLQEEDIEHHLLTNQISLPSITSSQIMDRSKADYLGKTFACIQITWFIAQVISRAVQHLPITELEIITIAYAFLNFLTYAFWLKKPLNDPDGLPGQLEASSSMVFSLDADENQDLIAEQQSVLTPHLPNSKLELLTIASAFLNLTYTFWLAKSWYPVLVPVLPGTNEESSVHLQGPDKNTHHPPDQPEVSSSLAFSSGADENQGLIAEQQSVLASHPQDTDHDPSSSESTFLRHIPDTMPALLHFPCMLWLRKGLSAVKSAVASIGELVEHFWPEVIEAPLGAWKPEEGLPKHSFDKFPISSIQRVMADNISLHDYQSTIDIGYNPYFSYVSDDWSLRAADCKLDTWH
ncbi:hypothetical protein BT96DRAFT_978267 [Gymnopus androsaceus JB14]|uniref:Uncharacterized protein n=1 Tax=Gymnopus androsaceus JB14 TaxID=1447944 RepID=A0A6A4H9L9_9AGAR|nr:hypothetical protein BT96DRAFT_978267 [Gymnopus androsaceus JB14]